MTTMSDLVSRVTSATEYTNMLDADKYGYYNVGAYGAEGDNSTDDAEDILDAITAIDTAGGGILQFKANATYIVTYGFILPDNIEIIGNGATIKCDPTFGQGTIPTGGNASAIFRIGSTTSGETADNIKIKDIILNCNKANLTGTPGGINGITCNTALGAVSTDMDSITNVLLENVVIKNSNYDGLYINMVDGLTCSNVKISYCDRICCVVTGGKNITFDSECSFDYATGDTSGGGAGFWAEPNYSWQDIQYRMDGCSASFNYISGFILFNAGESAEVDIVANNLRSYNNVYDVDTSTYRTAPSEAAVSILPNGDTDNCRIFVNGIDSKDNSGHALYIKTVAGTGTTNINITVNDINSYNDKQRTTTGTFNDAIIAIDNTGECYIDIGKINVYSNIAAGGYVIATTGSSKNIFILDEPKIVGTYDYHVVYANVPTTRITGGLLNCLLPLPPSGLYSTGSDKLSLSTRPPIFYQDAVPTGDIIQGELVVHHTTGGKQYLAYKGKSDVLGYIDLRTTEPIRATLQRVAGLTVNAGSYQEVTVTCTGATLGNSVELSDTTDIGQLLAYARVSATNTVKIMFYNPTVGNITINAGYYIVVVKPNE